MLRQHLRQVAEWLKRVITEPRSELTRWQAMVRFAYDLGRSGARQLRRDRAPQMAAALSFRTLFGLLPVMAVGTIVVKALGGFDQFQTVIGEFVSSIGGDDARVAPAESDLPGASQSVTQWLTDLVGEVESINLAAIGWVGLAVLVYSALSLMVTIESCFNSICRAPEGRSWARRIPIYWTVLTLAPGAIVLARFVDQRFDAIVPLLGSAPEGSGWLIGLLGVAPVLWSFVATWIVMFVVYRLVPNTSVKTHPAFIGALVAAVLLELGKRTLGAYLENAVSISRLYGSLGLIPLFMFWVYLMWLVVLFGLEVSASLQMLAGRTLEEIEQKKPRTGLVDPASILAVMEVAAERFGRSLPTAARDVTDANGLPEPTVLLMLDALVEAGIVHRLDRDDRAVTLARPPEQTSAADLLEVGFALVDEDSGHHPALLTRLREAQRSLAQRATLSELLPPQPVAARSGQVP